MQAFKDKLIHVVNKEFPELGELTNIIKVPEAFTTYVFRLDCEKKSLIVKISYDPFDIESGKGDKERALLEFVNTIDLGLKVPKLFKYFENYQGFPGYIIFTEMLQGQSLYGKDFLEVAVLDSNVDALSRMLNKLHSFKYPYITDFVSFKYYGIKEYIDSYKERFRKSLYKTVFWTNELKDKLEKLDFISNYFADIKEFSVIHKDINYANILFYGKQLSAVVDWEGAFTAPICFEFAHVAVLAPIYGLSKWHNKLINYYCEKYIEEKDTFIKEIELVKLFVAFRYFARMFSHSSNSKQTSCVKEVKSKEEYYYDYIANWRNPFRN